MSAVPAWAAEQIWESNHDSLRIFLQNAFILQPLCGLSSFHSVAHAAPTSVLLLLLLPPVASTQAQGSPSQSSNFTHKRGLISLCCCGGWCYFSGFFMLLLEKLLCVKLPGDCSPCSLMQGCPEGLGIRRGGRAVGGTTELSCALLRRCTEGCGCELRNNCLRNKMNVMLFVS